MKPSSLPKSKPRERRVRANDEKTPGLITSETALQLTRSWGPMLASNTLISALGMASIEIARSDIAIIGIIIITTTALVTALVGKIKKII